MSNRYYGSLYLLTQGGEQVVAAYDHARSDIDVAEELWSLAGDRARAAAIAAVVERTAQRDVRRFQPEEVDELLTLLAGLRPALRRTVVDDSMRIPPDRLAHVRQRSRLIDVDHSRGAFAIYGVLDAVSRVEALGNILRNA